MQPRPAITLTDCRTGGTFLSGCLSNHSQIYWARGEPLGGTSFWKPYISKGPDRLRFIFAQQFYETAGCKVMVRQVSQEILNYLESVKNLRVIYLVRDDIKAQALSWEINTRTKYAHSWKGHEPKLQKVKVPVEAFKSRLQMVVQGRQMAEGLLKRLHVPTLQLTYEEITGGESVDKVRSPADEGICEFLGIDSEVLPTKQRKLNDRPWHELVTNAGELWPLMLL